MSFLDDYKAFIAANPITMSSDGQLRVSCDDIICRNCSLAIKVGKNGTKCGISEYTQKVGETLQNFEDRIIREFYPITTHPELYI